MSKIIPYNANSARICAGDKCVTVYGEAAEVIVLENGVKFNNEKATLRRIACLFYMADKSQLNERSGIVNYLGIWHSWK
jgi:hypothetical protein